MKKTVLAILCLTAVLSAVSACSKEAGPAAGAQTGGAPAAIAPEAAHAQAPGAAGGGGQGVQIVTGPVLETMDAATYTYVRVKTDNGDIWAASGQFKVAVGDRVVVPLEMPMENFRSNALKRDFPLIFFATRITREGEAPAAASAMGGAGGALPPGHDPAGSARSTVTEVIPQPAGGTTVATLWTNRKALAGKPVTVRAKVVKFNGGILGKNWFHLQDGTGTDKDGTNDITVTSAAETKVGDVVTIRGTLVLDKDFGSGYAYAVIIENATIQPGK